MKATVKDFFGSNLEQEVLDEVVLWEGAAFHNNIVTISHPYTDFEYLYFHGAFTTGSPAIYHLAAGYLDLDTLEKATNNTTVGTRADASLYVSVNVQRTGDKEFKISTSSTSPWEGRLVKVTGFKRRISRVGIDELMSAMSLPNLIANADLTDNPINQRNFNGNWSSLAVGAYGYDQWMKVSSTHMGYVVEAGKYRPNAKHTLTKDDVVLGEFISPASGHWIVSVPFATSGKFDLYAGQFKRPWHPVQDGLDRCLEHYEVGESTYINNATTVNSSHYYQVRFSKRKRKVPSVLRTGDGSVTVDSAGTAFALPTHFGFYMNKATSANKPSVLGGSWQADASITLAEVGGQITTV
ncbi:hypothetical protein DDN14_07885 [Vibrio cholerae]|nr:hypothetical protein [Vibrio cholerae]